MKQFNNKVIIKIEGLKNNLYFKLNLFYDTHKFNVFYVLKIMKCCIAIKNTPVNNIHIFIILIHQKVG